MNLRTLGTLALAIVGAFGLAAAVMGLMYVFAVPLVILFESATPVEDSLAMGGQAGAVCIAGFGTYGLARWGIRSIDDPRLGPRLTDGYFVIAAIIVGGLALAVSFAFG